MLEQKEKSVYWLIREANISHKAAYDLDNNQTKGIQFDTLYRICKALECTPNDIFKLGH
uniref:helix-turn-helix domain-containing protein n=1 Tax=Paenibacillus sp. FSL R5-0519 TaxID=2921648 RepID=UPI00403F511D